MRPYKYMLDYFLHTKIETRRGHKISVNTLLYTLSLVFRLTLLLYISLHLYTRTYLNNTVISLNIYIGYTKKIIILHLLRLID